MQPDGRGKAMKNRSERLAYAAAIGHTFITGLSFMFSKIGLGYSSPWDLLAYRFTASFVAIMIPVVSCNLKIPSVNNWGQTYTFDIMPCFHKH